MVEGGLGMLRPALELALVVARAGSSQTPPVLPPGPIRPMLNFAKLSERALATLRATLEDDGEFRRRVADQADPAVMGRVPYLWLTRPSGWSAEVEQAERCRVAAADAQADDRAERTARRRLASVEAALGRAEVDVEQARRMASEAGEELAAQRSARRAAEDATRDLAAAAEVMAGTITGLQVALEEATEARRELETLMDDAHGRIDVLLAERNDAGARAERGEAAADDARARLTGYREREGDVRASVARAVSEAADAAGLLGIALGQAAGALAGRVDVASDEVTGSGMPPGPAPGSDGHLRPLGALRSQRAGPGRLRASPLRRRPIELPPAVFDDSLEAASFLVAVAGVVVLVDGYNVSLAGWPQQELSLQRTYLISRLAALAARSGASVWVIFDGAEDHRWPTPPGAARAPVRVAFSPEGVDADEVIIDLVDGLPLDTPVVVATSDRRVADEVRNRGANVISTPQTLALLGRTVPGRGSELR